MSNQVLTGHPARLRDGGWGAHVNSPSAQPGDTINIETRAGKTWVETVDRVIWTGVDRDGNECVLVTCAPRPRDQKAVKAPPANVESTGIEDDDLP